MALVSSEEQRKKKREYMRAYRARKPDARRDCDRRYREKNRERVQAETRAWKLKNPDRVRAGNWRYRAHHPKKARAWRRAWAERNLEKVRKMRRLRKGRVRAATIGPIPEDYVEQLIGFQGGRCVYCHEPLPAGFHVDHVIPLSRGGAHAWENLVLACAPCNLRKGSRYPEELEV